MNKISKITFSLVCATVLLSNANASIQANEVADKLINLDKERQENPNINGSGIVVGVVDSVFNTDNPILKDKLIGSINNNIDSERFGSDKSTMLHGTQVASLIVGNGNELKGVANGAKYYGLAYLNPSPLYTGNFKADVEKMCEGVKKMRVKNFGDDFMEVPKIGNLKSFTLSCNARNFSSKNPYNPKSSVLSQKCWKNGSALNTYKTQINAI